MTCATNHLLRRPKAHETRSKRPWKSRTNSTFSNGVNGILVGGIIGLLFILPISIHAQSAPPTKVRRFALLMGANDGGSERMILRYAQSDAEAFARVLHEIGGVRKSDRLLVTKSEKGALLRGFADIKKRLQAAATNATQLEVIFYYSGHSDERGLLLGEHIFSFADLKKKLDQLPARVKIGVLDSCASGALVRIKGGRRTAPFLVDSSTKVSGYALLTSSSADENAQESERIGASYFTHYLISGLRGAADNNRDGRVTLSESYAYAFDETLYRTESSRGGPQHPNYDFQLAGAGDLVLTDLRTTDSSLTVPQNLNGRVFIRDARGRLVAEINKTGHKQVTVAIPKGRYEVTVDTGDTVRRGHVTVHQNAAANIVVAQLTTVKKMRTQNRGNDDGEIIYRKFAASIFSDLTTNPPGKVENRLAANLMGSGYSLRGIEVGIVRNKRDFSVHGIQWSFLLNRTHHLSGMQRGALNIATGDTKGAQIGFINMANTFMKGAQFGFVNTAREKSNAVQFGFINYMPDGILAISAWTSDTSLYNIGVKLGGRHTFSKFTLGTRAYSKENWISLGWGFGAHFESSRLPLWIEFDTTINALFGDRNHLDALDLLAKTKLSLGIRLYNTLSIFAGPLLNTLVSEQRKTVAVLPPWESGTFGNTNWEVSPGFWAGFQIEPKIRSHNTWKGNLDEE